MMVDIVMPLVMASMGPASTCVFFARNYDLKAGTIGDRLRAVRPTLFLGVPRVWEKVAEKLKEVVAANPITGLKLKLVQWAKGRGLQHQLNCQMVLPCLAFIQIPRLPSPRFPFAYLSSFSSCLSSTSPLTHSCLLPLRVATARRGSCMAWPTRRCCSWSSRSSV
jgi:hypothetical protein